MTGFQGATVIAVKEVHDPDAEGYDVYLYGDLSEHNGGVPLDAHSFIEDALAAGADRLIRSVPSLSRAREEADEQVQRGRYAVAIVGEGERVNKHYYTSLADRPTILREFLGGSENVSLAYLAEYVIQDPDEAQETAQRLARVYAGTEFYANEVGEPGYIERYTVIDAPLLRAQLQLMEGH